MRASTSPAFIARHVRRFARCERGAVMPLFLVSAAVIFGASLGGIDLARHASATTRLQNALDGAALAMGRLAASEQDHNILLAEGKRYFAANFPPDYQGSGVDANKLSLSINESGRVLTLAMNGSLPLLSTGFLDVSAAPLRAKSTVTLQGNPQLEVVFSRDISTQNGGNFATKLANVGALLLDQGNGDIAIGTVPFFDVVNVGTESRQKGWVANWLKNNDSGNNIDLEDMTYDLNHWSGCITEPAPWNPPSLSPLRPSDYFMPLFVRVKTFISEKDDLQDKSWAGSERVTQYRKQPISIDFERPVDGYFWAAFDPGPGNGGKSEFNIFTAHDPEKCMPAAKMHFLDNTNAAIDALEQMANLQPVSPAVSIPPTGLLWSWRMLHEDWRRSDGWNAEGLPVTSQDPERAIVLITPGVIDDWSDLVNNDKAKTNAPFSSGDNGGFAFRMKYHTDTCKAGDHKGPDTEECHNGSRFERVYDHSGHLSLTVWQYPVSSLAASNPFYPDHQISFGNWLSVFNYTKETCSKIDKNIRIFVLSPSKLQAGVREAFEECAGDRFYTFDEMDALANALLNLRSESSTLRLVPSQGS